MSEVKVVNHWPKAWRPAETNRAQVEAKVKVITIGASTGGPPVLKTILAALPQDIPVSVLFVQHMAACFTRGFVQWLAQTSSQPASASRHAR